MTEDEVAERIAGEIRRLLPRAQKDDREAVLLSIDLLREEFLLARATRHEREGTDIRHAEALVDADLALRLDELELAEHLYAEALEAASPPQRSRALAGLGQLAFARGDPRQAIELLEAAGDATETSSNISAADVLGRAYAMVGEHESAIAVFERAYEDSRERKDSLSTLRFSVLLSNALIDAGNFGRASELLRDALTSAADSNDPIIRARLWWSQSRLHAQQNDPDTAARYARRALETLELTEHTMYTARAYQLLAHIELGRGRPAEALELLEDGFPLIDRSANRYEHAMFQLEKARALAQLGRTEEAAAIAMKCVGDFVDASPSDAGRGFAVVAETFAELGDRARAIELYELAGETLPDASSARQHVAARHAELLEADGRKEEALDLLKRALGLRQTHSPMRPS